jgi:hypothetical protein
VSAMIERGARAVCAASGGSWRSPPFNNLHTDALNNRWRYIARAAIEAMREPTEAMVEAHYKAHADTETVFADAEDVWRAMIDAAIMEKADA